MQIMFIVYSYPQVYFILCLTFQYYPDARMTPREAKSFFAHIKRSHPELTVTLRSHLNSMGDWMKVKKVFFPRAW